jgi:hypothetical protein
VLQGWAPGGGGADAAAACCCAQITCLTGTTVQILTLSVLKALRPCSTPLRCAPADELEFDFIFSSAHALEFDVIFSSFKEMHLREAAATRDKEK